ncbi:tetratricopeptide repeat [Trichoderma cornu-damae]|uniref:Tetratricopeptide repeat n=1 Tax=Trichoderma cornu-damae TaxID=654480 RepID=A0A9P8QX68_9HYPO|nr:tetratricopeptide repeat [Trichoderma cornu-damae]
MRQIRGPRSADAFATALWASASEAGYRPSTLSLARHLARSGAYGRIAQLRKVEARFKQLVSAARDPDALTVEGELQYEQGNYEAAIRALQRALQVGPAGFEWKPYCRLCMGKAFVKTSKHDEARAMFESLSEIGLIEADVELGKLLRVSDRDAAERHLLTAASHGRGDMFSLLSEIALEKAAESGEDKTSKEEFLRWAKEWSKLADSRTEY